LDIALTRVTKRIAGFNASQRGMVRAARGAQKRINGKTAALSQANVVMVEHAARTRQVAQAQRATTGSTGAMVKRFGTLAVAAGATFLAFRAADFASNFNQQLVATQKIMGATDEQLGAMEEKILDVGLRTKFSPDEIVEGMKNLGSAGLAAGEAMAAIEPAALLATAGQIGLDSASRAIVGTLKSFSLEADQAGIVADKLARTTQLSNLQAADFEIGLSKAAASMGAFEQSMDDTLVGLGALRNANIDASSASTALRESVRRVFADKRAREQLKGLGIDVDKLNESEHGLIDTIFEVDAATKDMTKSQRDAKVAAIFGARGLLAFNSISKLTHRTMRDGQEVTLKGAEAFEVMREKVANADGTVKDFNDAMLDTFEGQKQILSGAVDTLRVVLGQGFARVLKPVVRFTAESVGKIAKFIKELSPQTKEAVAKLAGFTGVVLGLVGAVIAVGAPVAAVIAGIGTAVVGVKRIIDTNVGGIGDRFRGLLASAKLFFRGFSQLITDGFLSGETLASLQEEENANVLTALVRLVQIGHRIQRFWGGIQEGFRTAMEGAAPTFEALQNAFDELGKALGFAGDEFTAIKTPSERFAAAGRVIGKILARLVEGGAQFLVFWLRFRAGLVKGVRTVLTAARPALDNLRVAFGRLVEAGGSILRVLGLVDGGFGKSGDTVDMLAQVLVSLIQYVLIPMINAWAWVFEKTAKVWRAFAIGIAIVRALINAGIWLKDTIVDGIAGAFDFIAEKVPVLGKVIDVFDRIVDRITQARDRIREFRQLVSFGGEGGVRDQVRGAIGARVNTFLGSALGVDQNAGAAASAAGTQRAREFADQAQAQASALAQEMRKTAGGGEKANGQATNVTLMLDSEVLLEVLTNAQQTATAAGFGG